MKEPLARAETSGDELVVTATSMRQRIIDAPASISVITREEIARRPVTTLADVLSRVPGVTGGYALSGAQSKISLRGLPSQYTLILVDGKRIGNSSGVNYRDDLGRQDLDWISPEMIERIEVVRGPMSSLYGSDAMGGVINIITRGIGTRWSGSGTFNYSLPESDERGETSQLGLNVSGPLTDTLGLRFDANRTYRESDAPRTAASLTPGFKNKEVNALLSWRPVAGHTFSVNGSYGVQKASGSDTVSQFGLSELERVGAGISHDGRYGAKSSSTLSLIHNAYKDKGSGIGAETKETVVDGAFRTGFDTMFDQAVAVGFQWRRDEIFNEWTVGTVPVDYLGKARASPRAAGNSWALFAEDHVSLVDKLVLTLGGRVDKVRTFKENFSPRAYLVWHPAESFTVRGGVSRGFRAPNLKEGTSGAATQSGGNGCTSLVVEGWSYASPNADGTQGCYMAGNPDLKPETSTNYEIGASYDKAGWSIGATYFHTDFINKIQQVPLRDIPGYTSSFVNGFWWTVAQNIQKARTRGIEATVDIPLHRNIRWNTNLTRMLESRNRTTGQDLLTVPELTVNSSMSWNVTSHWTLFASGQHIGKQLTAVTPGSRRGPTFAKAFTLFDLTTSYDLSDMLTLRAGVRNFTNELTVQDGNGFDSGSRLYFAGLTARL